MRWQEPQQIDAFAPLPVLTAGSTRRAAGASSKARREAGMARAQAHAEDDCPGWTERAAAFLRDYSLYIGGAFLIEQGRLAARGKIPAPDNLKAWGPATQMAVRKGYITKIGYAPACSSNGSAKGLFVAGEGIR